MKIQFPALLTIASSDTSQMCEVKGDYAKTRDPLGTGDSPTEYTFDYPQVFLPTKEEVPPQLYNPADIQQRAIKFMKGY